MFTLGLEGLGLFAPETMGKIDSLCLCGGKTLWFSNPPCWPQGARLRTGEIDRAVVSFSLKYEWLMR